MGDKKERTEGKAKIATYLRWLLVTVFGLLFVLTVIMAIYRKFGG